MSLLSELEDQVVGKLNDLTAAQGGYVQLLKAYNSGQEKDWKRLIIRFPAVIVAFASGEYSGQTERPFNDEIPKGSIALADANLRGLDAQRRGSGVAGEGPGLWQMKDDVYGRLDRQPLIVNGRQTGSVQFHGWELWEPEDEAYSVLFLDFSVRIPSVDILNINR